VELKGVVGSDKRRRSEIEEVSWDQIGGVVIAFDQRC